MPTRWISRVLKSRWTLSGTWLPATAMSTLVGMRFSDKGSNGKVYGRSTGMKGE